MKTQAQIQSQVSAFNKTFNIGDKIKIEKDNGEIQLCTIWHPATVLPSNEPVVWVNEISGAYSLDRVRH